VLKSFQASHDVELFLREIGCHEVFGTKFYVFRTLPVVASIAPPQINSETSFNSRSNVTQPCPIAATQIQEAGCPPSRVSTK
jgi:hypothetical protein